MEDREEYEAQMDDLSEEFAKDKYSEPIQIDNEKNEYFQIIAGEEGDERYVIDGKYYPIIDRYL
jgi:hypothetical protein